MLDRMQTALRLTREGRTREATALLRDGLSGGDGASPADRQETGASKMARGTVEIDGDPANPPRERSSGGKTRKPRATRPTAGDRPGPSARARTLRDTLAEALSTSTSDMARAAVRARAKRGGATPTVPAGRFEWRTHAGPHGSRRYRLFVPAGASEPMPLVMMLHGCTQDPDDFAAGTRILDAAAERGLAVVLPEQTRQANAMACWNWFERAHQGTRGEPAILAGIANEVIASERIVRSRVIVAGLSAGGAMAVVLGEAYPDLFGGVGVHSGLPTGVAHDMPSAMTAMRQGPATNAPARSRTNARQRLFVMHGDADTTVSPRNADALLEGVRADAARSTELPEGTARVVRLDRADGTPLAEAWRVPGLGHAWAGGAEGASYTAPDAPDATGAMLDFLLA